MPITHTNRKGWTYTLCQGSTKTGKPRYFFAREPKGEVLDAVPEGCRIEESVNGVVSLVKERPTLIEPEESAAVEAALKLHPHGGNYRVTTKDNQIIVHEGLGAELGALFAVMGRTGQEAQAFQLRSTRYTPIMRFVLYDHDKRLFGAERWHFSGSIDAWFGIGRMGRLDTLARALIPVLGTEAYFELD